MASNKSKPVGDGFYMFAVLGTLFGALVVSLIVVNVIKEIAAWTTLLFS